ncbi:MAG: hypothetical protein JXN64_07395 [Spirochaetes bacterium]|nr:hypothetical protein [Spirochaetota bacterium]
MLKKIALFIICTFLSTTVYSQSAKEPDDKIISAEKNLIDNIPNIPAQIQYSGRLEIRNVSFNKKLDVSDRGEILETEFILQNNTEEALELYLFVIATFEKTETKSSFEIPVPESQRMKNFVPFPGNKKNFEYTDSGKKAIKLIKFPKNPKAGINPATGKPYYLKDKLNISSTHLSRHRNNYLFFNEIVVLIFDKDCNPIYRQLFSISGKIS